MSWVMVDVEADGPIPGDYSMVSVGAVKMEPEISKTFYAEMRPISDKWDSGALDVCKFTREQTLQFQEPLEAMRQFYLWLKKECGNHLFFISDNAGFDWQFVNWYFHHFIGNNPFGFASTDQLSLYKGLIRDMYRNFKSKKYHPSHNALEDALANAKTLLEMKARYSLKINW